MSDKIVFEGSGVELECPPEPATPNDLAELIVRLRRVRGGAFASTHLTDNAVRKLLPLAFNLSIKEDEGRFPRVRLVSGTSDDRRLSVQFATPLQFDDVQELRRLTPAGGAPDFALLITESPEGELYCPGLANIGHRGETSKPGRPELVPMGRPPSLTVWLEGPGHLLVEEVANSFEYRAGRVRLVVPALYAIPALRNLKTSAGQALHTRAVAHATEVANVETYFGGAGGMSALVQNLLKRLLSSCLEMRHGGAFVILPGTSPDPQGYGVPCKFPLQNPDLGEDLARYWAVHILASAAREHGIQEYNKQLEQCNRRKATLFTDVDAVAAMSATDGCVVMTEEMKLLGFGGNITVSEQDCKKESTQLRLSRHETCSCSEFLQYAGGQRHQSAARLVIKYRDAIAMIVSQDGEMSVIAQDDDKAVRVYRPVDPFISPSE